MLSVLIPVGLRAKQSRETVALRRKVHRARTFAFEKAATQPRARICQQGSNRNLLRVYFHAPRRDKIASAASFARPARSPTGPTHDGQPFSQGHAETSSRVFARSKLCAR